MELRKGARDEFNSLLEQLIVPTLVKATHRGEREIRLGKGKQIFKTLKRYNRILVNSHPYSESCVLKGSFLDS